jgi:prolyl oligopeptidase
VVPFHSYKFAATLQDKTLGKSPVLLYTVENAGHGAAGRINNYIYSFMYKNMGLKPSEVKPLY